MSKRETINVNLLQKAERYTYFTGVLYPDCIDHRIAMDYMTTDGSGIGLQLAYILHDHDVYDEDAEDGSYKKGDPKKPHWHWLAKMPYPTTEKSFREGWERLTSSHDVKGVSSVLGISMYMTHSDPKSRMMGKYKYEETDIRGDLRIVERKEDITWDGFVALLNHWTYDLTDDTDTSFGALVTLLGQHGYLDFVRKNGFLATKSMTDAQSAKRRYIDEVVLQTSAKLKHDEEKKRRDEEEAWKELMSSLSSRY